MQPPIQAVLFDYGLVLTGPADPAAWARMKRVLALDEPAFHAAYWAPRTDYDRGTHTGASYWQAVAHRSLTPAELTELIEADTDLWTQPNQPMIDWALRLQHAGTRTGILSNLGDSITAGILTRLPWLSGFSHHVFSHTLAMVKPDPAIYTAAIRGLDVPAPAILFVDDRADNIAGALAAGLQAIQYTTQQDFLHQLRGRGLATLWETGNSTLPKTEL